MEINMYTVTDIDPLRAVKFEERCSASVQSIGICWVHADYLVVPALAVADIHVRHAARNRVGRDLGGVDAVSQPSLAAVGRTVDVAHLIRCDGVDSLVAP